MITSKKLRKKIDSRFLKPERAYKNKGWKSFSEYINKYDFITYDSAKKVLFKLKIKSAKEFNLKHRKNIIPKNIPLSPQYFYKDEWVSWPVFLGSNPFNEKNRTYLNFIEAKKYVKKLNLKNLKEWQYYSKTKRPLNLPGKPNIIYKKQWNGWVDFLGNKFN